MKALAKQDVTLAKRPQKASLRSVKRLLWSAILRTSQVIENSDDEALVVKAAHGLAQLSGAFARIHESSINETANSLAAKRLENFLSE